MLLAECLANAPADQLARMARELGLPPGGQRRELVARLVRHLTDPGHLAGSMAQLSPEEWQALKVVYWGGGGGPGITVELCQQLVGLRGGRRRASGTRALLRLMDRGLIYTRKAGYREVYFIPAELQPTVAAWMARQMVQAVEMEMEMEMEMEAAPPAAAGADGPDLVEELVRLWAHVYQHPLPLTQQGLIFKRHLRPLLQQLGIRPGGLARSGGAEGGAPGGAPGGPAGSGGGSGYPEPLGLLADFSLSHGLLVKEGGKLQAGRELRSWVERSAGELRAALFHHWQERHPHPDLRAFLHLLRTVGSRWVHLPAAAGELAAVVPPGQRAALLPRLLRHVRQFLVPLRILVLSTDGRDEPLVCLTPEGCGILGEAGAKPLGDSWALFGVTVAPRGATVKPNSPDEPEGYRFVLQASGELVAPRPVPIPVLWRLELAANLVERGPALVYHLTRESVYRALQAGQSGNDLIDFLEAHSQTGLPQNLAFDIRSWSRAYGQVFFQEVCLLRCADPVLAAQIKASHRTGPYIRGEVSPTDLIVHRTDYDSLFPALQAEGFLPHPGIRGPEAEGPSPV